MEKWNNAIMGKAEVQRAFTAFYFFVFALPNIPTFHYSNIPEFVYSKLKGDFYGTVFQ